MSLDRKLEDTVDDLVLWSKANNRRTHAWAVEWMVSLLRPNEPRDVMYLLTNAGEIAMRDANNTSNILTSSRVTYASRCRDACRQFLSVIHGTPSPRSYTARRTRFPWIASEPAPPEPELTPEDQISELLLLTARCRFLRPYLFPAIAAAQEALNALEKKP